MSRARTALHPIPLPEIESSAMAPTAKSAMKVVKATKAATSKGRLSKTMKSEKAATSKSKGASTWEEPGRQRQLEPRVRARRGTAHRNAAGSLLYIYIYTYIYIYIYSIFSATTAPGHQDTRTPGRQDARTPGRQRQAVKLRRGQ